MQKQSYLIKSALTFIILAFTFFGIKAQVSVYVNDNSTVGDGFTLAVGNDANAGTISAPFATIAKALTVATISGSVIHVDAGSYNVTAFTLPTGVKLIGLCSSNTTIIQSNSSSGTITLNSNTELSRVKVTRLTPTSAGGQTTISVASITGGTNIKINNCFFEKCRTAVYVNGSLANPGVKIENNNFTDNRTAILFADATQANHVIKANNIINSRSFGVLFLGSITTLSNILFENNNLYGNLASQLEVNGTGAAGSVTLRNNWFGTASPTTTTIEVNGGFSVDDHNIVSASPYNFTDANGGVTPPNYPNDISGSNTPALNVVSNANSLMAYNSSACCVIMSNNPFSRYATIQDAINFSNAGATINVCLNNYNENITINKSITLIGNGGAPNARPIISGSNAAQTILVTAPNVTIDNFEIRVNMPTVTRGITTGTSGTFNNLSITNNLIVPMGAGSFGTYGMFLGTFGGAVNDKLTITNNTVSNALPTSYFGRAIRTYNYHGDISNNQLSGIYGAQLGDNGGGVLTATGNTFNGKVEINNLAFAGNHAFTNNTCNPLSAANPEITDILLELKNMTTTGSNLSIQNNQFHKVYNLGIFAGRVKNVTLQGNTLTADANAPNFTLIRLDTKQQTSAVQTAFTSELTAMQNILNGNAVGGQTGKGIVIANSDNVSIIGTVLINSQNQFSANLNKMIVLNNETGPTTADPFWNGTYTSTRAKVTANIDASDNLFDIGSGMQLPAAMSTSNLFLLEDKIQHQVDDGGLGFVNVKANNVYVTTNSFVSPATTSASLQRGIDAAASGGIVNVNSGTYNEGTGPGVTKQVTISKDLSIVGFDKLNTIIKPNGPTASSGDGRGWLLVNGAFDVHMNDLTFDGNGFNIWQAIRHKGGGTIENCLFKNIKFDTYYGIGIGAPAVVAGKPLHILNSTFENIGRVGLNTFNDGSFIGNTYTGKGTGDWIDYAVDMGNNANLTISNNTISNNKGVASTDGSTSAGLFISSYFTSSGPAPHALVTGNFLTNNTTGLYVGYDAADFSVVEAHNNSITGNDKAIISTAPTVDATCNWYGTIDPAQITPLLSGPITYSPYLFNGTDNDPAVGFQPVPGACIAPTDFYVNDNSTIGDTYTTAVGDDNNPGTSAAPFATIAKAISVASGGNTIYVDAGTYSEQVKVNKGVTIIGTNTLLSTVDYSGTVTSKPTLFDISADGVTINKMHFNVDLAKLKSAIIASAAGIDNIVITNNVVDAYGTPSGGTYGDRNAVSVNYGGSTNYRVATGGVNSITFTGNTVNGTMPTSFFRSGISVDEGGGIFSNNTLQTINHDVLVRFANNGNVTISNNNFNGGGVELVEHNAGAGLFTLSGNNFTGPFANSSAPGTAILRLKNNQQMKTTIVSGNTFVDNNWAVSVENYNNVTFNNNSFTPLTGSTTFRHAVVNTKSISTNSSTIVQTPVGATFTNNTFNGSGTLGGFALSFLNHDNDNASFGTFTIGTSGNENNFNANLANAIYLDGQTGLSSSATFPAYTSLIGGGAGALTTMACWSTNINALNNFFEGQTGASALLAQNFAIEDKVTHKVDNSCLGLVSVKAGELFVTTNSGSVQRGVDASTASDILHVNNGVYNENVSVGKSLILKGANSNITCTGSRGTESIINGILGNNTQTIAVNADNVTIDGFSLSNPLGSYGVSANGRNNLQVLNNIISNVGNSTTGMGSSYGVYFEVGSTNNSSGVTISGNCMNNIRGGQNTSLTGAAAKSNNGSSGGVLIGSSNAGKDISNLVISGNSINNITASTSAFADGGKGAYGVIINVGANPANIGKAVSPQVTSNNIHTIEGLWAHGVGLEGETPGALVANNFVQDLTDHKGNTDAIGVLLEQNDGAATVGIHNNSLTNTALAIKNLMAPVVDITCNWYGTTDVSLIASKLSGPLAYQPFLSSGVDNDLVAVGFQPAPGTCTGPTELYVNDNSSADDMYTTALGNDNNPGTASAPLATIAKALTYATDGDIIYVDAGNYDITTALNINKGVIIKGVFATSAGTSASRGTETILNDIRSAATNPGLFLIATTAAVEISGITLAGSKVIVGQPANANLTFKNNRLLLLAMPNSGQTNMIFGTGCALTFNQNFIRTTGSNPSNSAVVQVAGGYTGSGASDVMTVTNNIFKGIPAIPYNNGNGQSTLQLNLSSCQGSVSSNTFDGVDIGVLLAGTSGNFAVQNNIFENIKRDVANDIPAGFYGAGILLFNPTFSGPVALNGNTFQNSDCGIRTSNAGGSETGANITIGGNTFAGNIHHIVHRFPVANLSLSGTNILDGATISSATASQLFAMEDKIVHKVDVLSYGLVSIKPNNVYVTLNNFFSPGGTTTPSIQRGIDAASPGFTVNVNSGTFNENIVVGKAVTMKGANSNVACNGSRGPESIINGTLGNNTQSIAVSSDNVTINGFKISNPLGSYGISANGRSNLIVRYNILTNIGNSTNGGGASYGVYIEVGNSVNSDAITISDNCMNNIRGGENTSLTGATAKSNNGSSGGVLVGSSNAGKDISNLTISSNIINNITACTSDFADGGKGAYGVIINVGANAAFVGKAISPQVLSNEISILEGLWAHGVGLEGETPGALVANNLVQNLIDHKGNIDAIGVLLEQNDGAATVEIHNNNFEGLPIAIKNLMPPVLNATCNWYGSTNVGVVVSKISGNFTYIPYLVNGTDNDLITIGFQPVPGTCSGPNALYVNDNSTANDLYTTAVGNDANLGTADAPFATITKAVSVAAPGSTIYVDAGTYLEQVSINKSLSLTGAARSGVSTTTIKAPNTLTTVTTNGNLQKAIVYVNGIGNVVDITKVLIDGDGKGGGSNGFMGVYYFEAGGSISNSRITKIRDNVFTGNQYGTAVFANHTYDVSLNHTVTVSDNIIDDYQKGGIVINEINTHGIVTNNTITGQNVQHVNGENGIQFGYGAYGTITGNTVSGNLFNGPGSDVASGILLAGVGVDQTNTPTGNLTTIGGAGPLANNVNGNEVGLLSGDGGFGYASNLGVTYNSSTFANNYIHALHGAPVIVPAASNTYDKRVDNTSQTNIVYGQIQRAVNDASAGNALNASANTFTEQVEISKSLTLSGQGTGLTKIVSPNVLLLSYMTSAINKPVVYVHDASNVVINNLTVDGAGKGNANNRFQGIAYRNAGGTVQNCEVIDVRNNPIDGVQAGIAIAAFADNGTARTFNLINNTISGFQKNATSLAGADLTVNVDNNTITGAGSVSFTAQNGVQISTGATGTITNNTISGFSYTPATVVATGVLVFSAGGNVATTGNIVNDAQVGIFYYQSSGNIQNNTVSFNAANMASTPYWYGIDVENGTTTVTQNTINGGGNGAGIEADAVSGETTSMIATNNFVNNTDEGFVVYTDGTGVATCLIHENSITNSASFAIHNYGSATQDVTCNWYGTSDGPTVATLVSGPLTFNPFVNNGTDSDLGTPGFQPVLNSCQAACVSDNENPVITLKSNPTIYIGPNGQYTLVASDVIETVTDNCDPNPSIQLSRTAFSCADIVAPASAANHQAYFSPVINGNQAWQGELGMEFRVDNPTGIIVKQLGAFDHQGNGINGTISGGIRVAIFNKSSQTIVPGLDVIISGLADGYIGNHRMKNVAPVTLPPGNYVVVAKGYNDLEKNGNQLAGGHPPYGLDNGNGAIAFIESSYSDGIPSGFNYPQYPYAPSPNVFAAGTFIFELPSTGGGSATSTVTVTVTDATGNIAMANAEVTVLDNLPPVIIPKDVTVYINASGQATIQPADVIQSITDNCGVDNASIQLSRTTFTCADIGTSGGSGGSTNHQAYSSPITVGNQAFQGEMGMEFRVNNAAGIVIKQLGAFDHQGNGIIGTIGGGVRVAVFNKSSHTIIPGLDEIIIGNADAYIGNHRMKNIAPITLMPGNYVVVAKGYNTNELNGNQLASPPQPTYGLDNGNGALSFIESSYSDDNPTGFNYPQYTYPPSANVFLAGTMLYDVLSNSGGGGGSNPVVTIMVSDIYGNSSSAQANVIVQDITPPVIIPKNAVVNLDVSGQGSIQNADVIQSFTDNCSIDNSSIVLSRSTFDCSDIGPATPGNPGSLNHQAYNTTATAGNQPFQGEMGMEFKVNNVTGIVIKQLGAFDHNGDGLTGSGIRVAIFNKATHAIVPGLDHVIIGNADSYTNNHRMKNITPVTLMPGNYIVVAKGYNSNELNGNHIISGIPPYSPADLDGGNGAVSFIQSHYSDDNPGGFGYPAYPYPPTPNVFLAGTFFYDVPASGGGTGSGTVMVTITGADIYGNTAQAQAEVTVNSNGNCIPPIASPTPFVKVQETNNQEIEMKAFPNPARDQFTVQLFNLTEKVVTIQIMDQNGRMIEQKKVELTGNTSMLTVPFNLHKQAAGMYFIKVISRQGVKTGKLVLQR